MVRIRMSRVGRPHLPFYRINAVDARVKRDGAVIENLGWFNPVANKGEKALELKVERIKYWLSKGAQPSQTVRDFLAKQDLVNKDSWNADRLERSTAVKNAIAKKASDAAATTAAAEKKESDKKTAEAAKA